MLVLTGSFNKLIMEPQNTQDIVRCFGTSIPVVAEHPLSSRSSYDASIFVVGGMVIMIGAVVVLIIIELLSYPHMLELEEFEKLVDHCDRDEDN